MKSHPSFPRPPLVANWLLTFLTPADQIRPLTGDLLEEFATVASDSGNGAARRWYWRQALKTIMHVNASAVRAAPLLTIAIFLTGMWSLGFASRVSVRGMQSILDGSHLYESNPQAYLILLKLPLTIGRGFLCCLVGILAAVVSKKTGIAAVLALTVAQMAMFAAAALTLILDGHAWATWFVAMLPWNCLGVAGTVAGGAIVQARRIMHL